MDYYQFRLATCLAKLHSCNDRNKSFNNVLFARPMPDFIARSLLWGNSGNSGRFCLTNSSATIQSNNVERRIYRAEHFLSD